MKTRKLNLRLLFRLISVIIFGTVITLLSNCTGAGGKKTGSIDSTKGLKDFYKSYFDIGVAIAPQHTEGADAEFLKRHFNSITAENVMKPALIHPEENRYSWENADKIVAVSYTHLTLPTIYSV